MSRTFDSTGNPSRVRAGLDRVRFVKDEEAEVFDEMLELSLVKIDRVWVNEADIVEVLRIGIGTTATHLCTEDSRQHENARHP
jgi:hypothetical protein